MLVMRIFITVLVLIFSLQSWTKADDISDFQIEGMSIGDSLLDHFSDVEIKKGKINNYPKSKKFSSIKFWEPTFNFETYDSISISFKTNDKNYQIFGLAGAVFYDLDEKNIEDCYKKKDEIVEVLSNLFENTNIYDDGIKKYPADPTGESTVNTVYFDFKSGASAKVGCADYSKEKEKDGFSDHMQISIYSKVFVDFLSDEAY